MILVHPLPFSQSPCIFMAVISISLSKTLDSSLSMHQQVTNTCTAAYIELRRISLIFQYLTVDATKTLVSAFVLSRLDYCNALLSDVPQYPLDRLQRVQNAAARLTVKAFNSDHITPVCTHSIGCQWQLEFSTKYPPTVTVLCQIPVLNTCPGS